MKPTDTIYLGCRLDHCPIVLCGPSFLPLDPAPARKLTSGLLMSFEWGFRGMGPLQLAVAILLDHLGDASGSMALHFHGQFMRERVAHFPQDGFTLYAGEINAFLLAANVTNPFNAKAR